MGKAIAVAALLVLFSFLFVFAQLWQRRGAAAAASRAPGGPAPLLETREDGSVYDLGIQLSRFERRLIEEEKRSAELMSDLDTMRRERDALAGQVANLQSEIRGLRRELEEKTRRPADIPSNLPANLPADAPPGTSPPTSPETGNP